MAWELDKAHSEVGFAVKHMMISTVRGKFTSFDASVTLDPAALESAQVTATVDVASITTGDEARDNHLRAPDFFDAEKHPQMKLVSKRIARDGDEVIVTADLTIRGVTKEVALRGSVEGPAKDPWGGERIGYSLQGELDREDFGLTWNQALETGGVLVGKKVKIELEGQLVKK